MIMLKVVKKSIFILLEVVFAVSVLIVAVGHAAISGCGASTDVHAVNAGTISSFNFEINNTSASTVHWIHLTRPDELPCLSRCGHS